jgi:hypothetical protein
MDRIVSVVKDLCDDDLEQFITTCKEVCIYNQQHLIDVIEQENRTFPQRFFTFIDQYA